MMHGRRERWTAARLPSLSAFGRAVRSLRRSPGFIAVAAISLGTALGITTATFALIDSVTHPVSPIPEVDRVVAVQMRGDIRHWPAWGEIKEAIDALPGVERWSSEGWAYLSVGAAGGLDMRYIAFVGPEFPDVMRIQPRLGRMPTRAEMTRGSAAVVSDRFWRSKFGDRPTAIDGAGLWVAGQHAFYEIVGVLPLNGDANATDVWLPDLRAGTPDFWVHPVLLLKPGAQREQVLARLQETMHRFTQQYGGPGMKPFGVSLSSFRPDPLGMNDILRTLMFAVGQRTRSSLA